MNTRACQLISGGRSSCATAAGSSAPTRDGAALTIVAHRRCTSPRRARPGQDEALKRVVHHEGQETRDRAVAILILVFGQQAENIARLTWNDVTVNEELVTIQRGTTRIALPDPLIEPWHELAANPAYDLTASHPIASGYSAAPLSRAAHPRRTPLNPAWQTIQYTGRAARNSPRTHQTRTGGHHRRNPRLLPRHYPTPNCLCRTIGTGGEVRALGREPI